MPEILETPVDTNNGNDFSHWVLIVYNNEVNTVDEVINILMRATGCNKQEAQMETWEIHNLGKTVVHHGSEEECSAAAKVISSIGIVTEVNQE